MNLQTIAAFLAASSQYLGLPSSEPGAQTVELFEQIGHQRRQFGYGLEVADRKSVVVGTECQILCRSRWSPYH